MTITEEDQVFTSMVTSVKERWINALRSGDYVQCQNELHNDDGFCCLGVLYDIEKFERGLRWEKEGESVYYWVIDGGQAGELSPEFKEIVGLDTTAEIKLVKMNDSGHDFEEIADWIEEHL